MLATRTAALLWIPLDADELQLKLQLTGPRGLVAEVLALVDRRQVAAGGAELPIEPFLDQERRRAATPLARPAPGSALGRPPGAAPRPTAQSPDLSFMCLRRGLRLKDGPGSAGTSTVSVWLR